jgi:hypothetical protein
MTHPVVDWHRCGDRTCPVRATCPLFTDPACREPPVPRYSLRLNWECRTEPCLARQRHDQTLTPGDLP